MTRSKCLRTRASADSHSTPIPHSYQGRDKRSTTIAFTARIPSKASGGTRAAKQLQRCASALPVRCRFSAFSLKKLKQAKGGERSEPPPFPLYSVERRRSYGLHRVSSGHPSLHSLNDSSLLILLNHFALIQRLAISPIKVQYSPEPRRSCRELNPHIDSSCRRLPFR